MMSFVFVIARSQYYYSDEATPGQRRSQHSSPGRRYRGGGQAWKGTGFLFQYKNPPQDYSLVGPLCHQILTGSKRTEDLGLEAVILPRFLGRGEILSILLDITSVSYE